MTMPPLALALVVVAAGAPTGLKASTPQEMLASLEVACNDILGGKGKDGMFATKAELKSDIGAYSSVSPKDVDHLVAQTIKERKPQPGQPKSFVAVDAMIAPASDKSGSQGITFFDAAGKNARMTVHVREGGVVVLYGSPYVEDGDLQKYVADGFSFDRAKIQKTQHFTKKDGAWVFVPPPPEPKPTCTDAMKSLAKSVFVAEESYRAEFDKYSVKLDEIGLTVDKAAKVTVKKADAAAFLAEVALAGGTGTISEKNDFTVVTACKEAP